jgi:hypothetical protein
MITFKRTKLVFDRSFSLLAEDERLRKDPLIKGAVYVKRTAERSMRRRAKPSKPGQPPSARTDRPRGGALRNLMVAEWDSGTQTAVIGPKAIGGRPHIPALHEFGESISNPTRLRARRLGGGGEIRLVGRDAMQGRDKTGRFKTKGGRGQLVRGDYEGRGVVYAKLRTARQVERARRINAMLYGNAPARIKYPARPTMKPALANSLKRMPEQFRNALEGRL